MAAESSASTRSRRILIIVSILGVMSIIGGGLLYWYLNQPVPEEATLEDAVGNVASTVPAADDTPDTTAGPDGVEGEWSVDTSVGEFSFETATSSYVGFRIEEELASVGATTAVGRTPAVDGSLTVAGAIVTDVTIEADMSRIITNASRRDRAVQSALDTGSFPTATFTLTEPIDLGSIPTEGAPVSVAATGTLTIKGVTLPIEIPLDTQLANGFIVVVGSVDITFADWDVELPTSPGVVSIEDHGLLEIQLFFSRG